MLPKDLEQDTKKDIDTFRIQRGLAIILLTIGILVLFLQLTPLFLSLYRGWVSQNVAKYSAPLSSNFIKRLFVEQYYDPGAEYLDKLAQVYNNSHKQTLESSPTQIKIDTDYKKTMHISVVGTKIKNITLTPNVSGDNKKEYESALNHGVAHLKGTPLPGDGGISIVYGHSGIPRLLTKNMPPKLVFTYLEKVKLGDTVIVEKDGKKLYYKVIGRKIIKPYELNILSSLDTSREKLVLVTCWPAGIGTSRLIIIAERK